MKIDKKFLKDLWIVERRNNKYGDNNFHGNFISEIPEQMILRYTKENETVWDCFAGSGTTMDVCKELKRKCISNDLSPIRNDIIVGDSKNFSPEKNVQLVIIHPPYAGIIRFSDKEEDISNVEHPNEFYPLFEKVIKNVTKYLDEGRILILVIGDCYLNGEQIPLAFNCMNIVIKNNYKLKSIIVKNMGVQSGLKGYETFRALQGGYFFFDHEYIFVLQKLPITKKFNEMTNLDFNKDIKIERESNIFEF